MLLWEIIANSSKGTFLKQSEITVGVVIYEVCSHTSRDGGRFKEEPPIPGYGAACKYTGVLRKIVKIWKIVHDYNMTSWWELNCLLKGFFVIGKMMIEEG